MEKATVRTAELVRLPKGYFPVTGSMPSVNE